MRRMTAILSVAAIVVITAGLSAQTKPNFAGEWKLDDSTAANGGGRSGTPGRAPTVTKVTYKEYVRGFGG